MGCEILKAVNDYANDYRDLGYEVIRTQESNAKGYTTKEGIRVLHPVSGVELASAMVSLSTGNMRQFAALPTFEPIVIDGFITDTSEQDRLLAELMNSDDSTTETTSNIFDWFE